MPVLPLIDLLILSGWTSLMLGAALKLIALATRYRPDVFGLTSLDFAIIAGVAFGFALTLAARTWVKLNEPRLVAAQRRAMHLEGVRIAREAERSFERNGLADSDVEAAGGERR